MFGHQDDQQQSASNSNADAVASAATAPVYSDQMQQLNSQSPSDNPTIATDPVVENLSLEEHGEEGVNKEALSPAGGYPQPASQKIKQSSSDDEPEPEKQPQPPAAKPAITDEDLPHIKQQVISELFPLIDELDQPPEERFKTLMMMIQATDNQSLIN